MKKTYNIDCHRFTLEKHTFLTYCYSREKACPTKKLSANYQMIIFLTPLHQNISPVQQ